APGNIGWPWNPEQPWSRWLGSAPSHPESVMCSNEPEPLHFRPIGSRARASVADPGPQASQAGDLEAVASLLQQHHQGCREVRAAGRVRRAHAGICWDVREPDPDVPSDYRAQDHALPEIRIGAVGFAAPLASSLEEGVNRGWG